MDLLLHKQKAGDGRKTGKNGYRPLYIVWIEQRQARVRREDRTTTDVNLKAASKSINVCDKLCLVFSDLFTRDIKRYTLSQH